MPTTVAALELNLAPVPVNLCITRRDSFPFGFVLEQDGSGIDLTGTSFLLTVNPDADGSGADLFAIAESNVLTTDGVVQFTPSVVNLTQTPAVYYYDVQWTDGAEVRTVVNGTFTIGDDISD